MLRMCCECSAYVTPCLRLDFSQISLHLSTAILKSDSGSLVAWGKQAITESRVVPADKAAQFKQELNSWVSEVYKNIYSVIPG